MCRSGCFNNKWNYRSNEKENDRKQGRNKTIEGSRQLIRLEYFWVEMSGVVLISGFLMFAQKAARQQ